MGNTINIILAFCDILNGLAEMDLKEIDTLSFISMAIFILLIYYVFSKDRTLSGDRGDVCLRKEMTSNTRTKCSGFYWLR